MTAIIPPWECITSYLAPSEFRRLRVNIKPEWLIKYQKDFISMEPSFTSMTRSFMEKMKKFPGNVGYGSRENGAFQCPSQSKCSFGMTSVGFLGHIFDEHGVHLSDKSARDSRYSYP